MQRVWKPPQQDAPKAATGWWEGFGVARQLLTCRSNYAQNSTSSNSVDENRLIVSYTMPLW